MNLTKAFKEKFKKKLNNDNNDDDNDNNDTVWSIKTTSNRRERERENSFVLFSLIFFL